MKSALECSVQNALIESFVTSQLTGVTVREHSGLAARSKVTQKQEAPKLLANPSLAWLLLWHVSSVLYQVMFLLY